MYFGGRHTATSKETVNLPFRCAACGVEKTARVHATGAGTARSPFFVGFSSANDRAAEDAASDAFDVAARSLAFVACPRCGHRNAKKDGRFDPSITVACVALGAVCGLYIGGILVASIGLLLGLATGYVLSGSRAIHAAATVTFFDGEAPDKPVIGAKCKVCTRRIVIASDGLRCEKCGGALHIKKCVDEHARQAHGPAEASTPYR